MAGGETLTDRLGVYNNLDDPVPTWNRPEVISSVAATMLVSNAYLHLHLDKRPITKLSGLCSVLLTSTTPVHLHLLRDVSPLHPTLGYPRWRLG